MFEKLSLNGILLIPKVKNNIKKFLMNIADKILLSAYSGGYPFSISGDIRSLPS